MCFRETPFTALQQGDTYDQLRVNFPVQINRVIIKLASTVGLELTREITMDSSHYKTSISEQEEHACGEG